MERKEQAIFNGGRTCPHCDSEDVKQLCITIDTNSVYRTMECATCGKSYEVRYDIADIS